MHAKKIQPLWNMGKNQGCFGQGSKEMRAGGGLRRRDIDIGEYLLKKSSEKIALGLKN